jgi:hypothetical protein
MAPSPCCNKLALMGCYPGLQNQLVGYICPSGATLDFGHFERSRRRLTDGVMIGLAS